jgi:hypothetical protein
MSHLGKPWSHIVAVVLLCGAPAAQAEPVEFCLNQASRYMPKGQMDETEKGVINFMANQYVQECEYLYQMLERGRIAHDKYSQAMGRLTDKYRDEVIGFLAKRDADRIIKREPLGNK